MRIHPSALVAPEADLADEVEIGPFSVIEGPVKLAAGVVVGGHCHLSGDLEIGAETRVGWGCVLGADPQDLGFDRSIRSGVRIGPRNVLREYVTIHRGSTEGAVTEIGAGNFLMTGAHLAHDVRLGDDNVLANDVLLAGHVRVGDRSFLGGAAGFHQFIRVGSLAMVKGGSAISQDVPPYCVAHGSNRLAGLNVVGLRRAGWDTAARAELKLAFRLLFLDRFPLREAVARARSREWSPAVRSLVDAVAEPSRKGVMTRSR